MCLTDINDNNHAACRMRGTNELMTAMAQQSLQENQRAQRIPALSLAKAIKSENSL